MWYKFQLMMEIMRTPKGFDMALTQPDFLIAIILTLTQIWELSKSGKAYRYIDMLKVDMLFCTIAILHVVFLDNT